MRTTTLLLTAWIIFAFNSSVPGQESATPSMTPASSSRAEKYWRTELYMGMSIPGGGIVSDADWERFIGDFVTQLFPDGFSVLSGRGQYREATGTTAKEPSHILIFLYRRSDRKSAGAKIESIRTEYKKRFQQESVMRVDLFKSVRVSF